MYNPLRKIRETREELERAEIRARLLEADVKRATDDATYRALRMDEVASELHETREELAEAQQELERVKSITYQRVRIGTIRLDPREVESRIRRSVTDVKVEHEPSTFTYTVYALHEPSEADVNVVRAAFAGSLEIDLT